MTITECMICLDNFNLFDLNLLLNCGHQFHYHCALRIKDKKNCCLCKKKVEYTAKILYKKNTSFFENDIDFYSIVLNNILYLNIINRKSDTIKNEYKKEIIQKQKQIICNFVNNNLNLFRTRILAAVNRNKYETELCSYNYGYTLNEIPFVFLLYGPQDEGLDYFKVNNIPSLTEYLNYKLGNKFDIYTKRKNNINYIYCKWGII